jgi:hypothetical protein
MPGIAPSQQIEQAVETFLQGGLEGSEQPVSELLKLAAQRVIQEALEQEVTDYLGRGAFPVGRRGGVRETSQEGGA